MAVNIQHILYSAVIDPLLSNLRKGMHERIKAGSDVLDIACGTGRSCFDLASKCKQVTGIDNSAKLVAANNDKVRKLGLENVNFYVAEAGSLEIFQSNQFSTGLLSMAIHQFPYEAVDSILNEAFRVSNRLIIADYQIPLPATIYGALARMMEWLAGKQHYENFKAYSGNGGLQRLMNSDCILNHVEILGNGIFTLIEIEKISKP